MDSSQQSLEQQESTNIENQFHQVVSEIKTSFPIWDEFIFKAGKLQASIKSLVLVLGSFLETFQKLADIASGTKGGYSNDMGIGLTKLGLRQRGIEDKLKFLINALSDSLMGPTQDKLDDWKKSVVNLDKDHKNEFKKAQQDLKKASAEAMKLKKKVKKGSKPEVQKQLDNALSDHQSKSQNLEQIQRYFVRSAVGFSRGQFCHLVACFRPVVDIQLSMMIDLTSIQETMDILIKQSVSPPPITSAAGIIAASHPPPPPSPDTSKGSYQDLFPGKPPSQANPDESRKSSLSSSSSSHNYPPSPQHIGHKDTISSGRQESQQPQQFHRQHHHHHSCSSYESMRQQISQQQQQPQMHHHHHHCHHRSPPPTVSSPASSSSSSISPPPLLSSSSLPSSPTRVAPAKASTTTYPSPPPECSCGIVVTAKSSNPYALPLYIGDSSSSSGGGGGGDGGGVSCGSAAVASKATSDYTKLYYFDDDGSKYSQDTGGLHQSESESTLQVPEVIPAKGQNLTLEGYVKMNQLASYYASKHGDESSMKKDLSHPQQLLSQSLKMSAEQMIEKSSKTVEDVLDCLKKGTILSTGVSQRQQPRRSNLRDRSLPPSSRKNMRVQFVHQTSSPSPTSPEFRHQILLSDSPTLRSLTAAAVAQLQQPNKSVGKSPSMSRVADCMSSSTSSLLPLPPPEMLKQQSCFDDSNVDDLPLPPPPEELS